MVEKLLGEKIWYHTLSDTFQINSMKQLLGRRYCRIPYLSASVITGLCRSLRGFLEGFLNNFCTGRPKRKQLERSRLRKNPQRMNCEAVWERSYSLAFAALSSSQEQIEFHCHAVKRHWCREDHRGRVDFLWITMSISSALCTAYIYCTL